MIQSDDTNATGRTRAPNNQFQRSVNSRLRRLSPPAELGRSAPEDAFSSSNVHVELRALPIHGSCLRPAESARMQLRARLMHREAS